MKQIIFQDKRIMVPKVVCVGRNYAEHITELGNDVPSSMVIFNKPNSAIGNNLLFINNDVRFEGEICFLIQNNKIAGVGFGLDLTKAGLQNELKKSGLPWERAKAFDNSAIFSEFVEFDISKIETIKMELFINDTLAQLANYGLMIYKLDEIIRQIKSFMSLQDGDIIMSGTPKGVGGYSIGDVFNAKIYIDEIKVIDSEFVVSGTK